MAFIQGPPIFSGTGFSPSVSGGQPESVSKALAHCLEQTCSPAYRQAGGLQFGLGLFDDVASLLNLGGPAMICFLCDLHRLIQAAERELQSEKPRKSKSEMKRKLKLANRKVYFLMCWVHEQPDEAWSSLAAMVEVEKKSIAAAERRTMLFASSSLPYVLYSSQAYFGKWAAN